MTKTLENLTKAYLGECQARNRYTFYASVAKKEGYERIAANFLLTADQEKEHASWLFKLINKLKENDEAIHIETEVPTVRATTKENLTAAIAGENYEYTKMYPEFADIAEEDGHKEIAIRLRAIAKAEQNHEDRYKRLLELVDNEQVFKREEEVAWVCRECGYVHYGKMAPMKCPSCDHAQSFYEVRCENY